MTTYLYKAYDRRGHRKVGTLRVFSDREAHSLLREKGLKAYFLQDLKEVRRIIKHRKRVRKVIIGSGAAAIALALVVSGVMVGYAGRESALDVEALRSGGLLEGGAGNVVARTEEEKKFARTIHDAWQSFAPGILEGIEIHKGLMTVYVNRSVRKLPESDLEHLATSTTRALQRQLGTSGATLLIVEDDLTMMEVRYNGITKAIRVNQYL